MYEYQIEEPVWFKEHWESTSKVIVKMIFLGSQLFPDKYHFSISNLFLPSVA